MKVQISFKVIDPDFNPEYAKFHNFDEMERQSAKYEWGTQYEVRDIKSVECIEIGVYNLQGKIKETEYKFEIANVFIFRCHFNDNTSQDFAASKSIINKTHQAGQDKHKVIRFYFYLNNVPPCLELKNGVVLNLKDIPKEYFELFKE